MRRLCDEIDLHIVAMLVLMAPALCLGWWLLVVPLLVPQGRIYVRAFWDYPAFGRRPWAYLAANELLVVGAVGALAGLRVAVAAVA
ncbi:MAG TPA: hypothetical protein VKD90_04800 [Gemmataceae bacterium]|nr:hypothetical protein [Gemmataceae bacterium]